MPHDNKSVWSTDGASILSADNIAAITRHLQSVGSIAVEHWHYFGGRAPTPLAFDDMDEFLVYLSSNVKPGDAIDVYPFPSDPKTAIARGKYPDAQRRVPDGGAY
jgi:hypothetical protein